MSIRPWFYRVILLTIALIFTVFATDKYLLRRYSCGHRVSPFCTHVCDRLRIIGYLAKLRFALKLYLLDHTKVPTANELIRLDISDLGDIQSLGKTAYYIYENNDGFLYVCIFKDMLIIAIDDLNNYCIYENGSLVKKEGGINFDVKKLNQI